MIGPKYIRVCYNTHYLVKNRCLFFAMFINSKIGVLLKNIGNRILNV